MESEEDVDTEDPIKITIERRNYEKLLDKGELEKAITQMAHQFRFLYEESGDGVIDDDREFILLISTGLGQDPNESEEVYRCRPLLFPSSMFEE